MKYIAALDADSWTVGIGLATTVINLLLLVALIVQLRLLRLQLTVDREAVDLDHAGRRAQATLEFSTATLERQAQWKHLLPNYYEDGNAVRAQLQQLEPNDELNGTLQDFLGFFEELSTGVNLGVYDVAVVDHLLGTRVVRAYAAFEPWIDNRRERFQSKNLYGEFQLLAETIKSRRNAVPPP